MLCTCGLCRHTVSVTLVNSVKTSSRIFKIFPPSGSQTILVWPYHMLWQYSDGDSPNRASSAGGVGRIRNSGRIAGCRLMTAGHASNCDGWPCSLSHRWQRISKSLFIIACTVDEYAKENRTEFNCMQQ